MRDKSEDQSSFDHVKEDFPFLLVSNRNMMSKVSYYQKQGSFRLESGQTIQDLKIGYHTYGKMNKDCSNVVWVFHALSANSDVLDWWPGLFGESYLFSPKDYFIVCANVIGSPYGSSSADDLNFPQFSVRDVVQAHLALAEHLNIVEIQCAIGGSFGGDQAIEFAYSYPGSIKNLILIASSSRVSAWAIAIHETQRLAMTSDPSFGQKDGGADGMKAARAIGMLTYRTSNSFIDAQTDQGDKLDKFKASSYIQYQGDKFVRRFNALSYYYLTKCLDSHNLGRNRGGEISALRQIRIPTLVIGIVSDILIPIQLQKEMVKHMPNAIYREIESNFGHDGFLVETEKISLEINAFLNRIDSPLKVLKFGGKSLANGTPVRQVVDIIENESKASNLVVVVSARAQTTDKLQSLYRSAVKGQLDLSLFDELIDEQYIDELDLDYSEERAELLKKLEAISILRLDHKRLYDQIVSYGELMSVKAISKYLRKRGVANEIIDARDIIKTSDNHGSDQVDMVYSKSLTKEKFEFTNENKVYVVTGFIASDQEGLTSTLGRNGSNYTATLIANFLNANEVQNWTDVDGVFSGHPKYVKGAQKIDHLSYREANELANFGIKVLHSKTILPLLEAGIPLRIRNSFKLESTGTLVDQHGTGKGIKAVSLIEDVSLISIEGGGLLGKIGIDSRIFSRLSEGDISVRLISQASSEMGIGFVVNRDCAEKAEKLLNEEFQHELESGDIYKIQVNSQTAIVSIIGRHNYALEKAIKGLRASKIWVHLFSNSINGENISMVIDDRLKFEALNIVHEYAITNQLKKVSE